MRSLSLAVVIAVAVLVFIAAFSSAEFGVDDSGEEEHFVFRTEEEMRIFAQSLEPLLPDEQGLLEEIEREQEDAEAVFPTEGLQDLEKLSLRGKRDSRPKVAAPTAKPSVKSTKRPTVRPSRRPTAKPTTKRARNPTVRPTKRPTVRPTVKQGSRQPTKRPSPVPTAAMTTRKPFARPSVRPTVRSSARPSLTPSVRPSSNTVPVPVPASSASPSASLSARPSAVPVSASSAAPSPRPSHTPTATPSHGSLSPSAPPSLPPSPLPPKERLVVAGEDRADLLGPEVIAALQAKDALNTTGDALRRSFLSLSDALAETRDAIIRAVCTNATSSSDEPLTSISWSLSHDSVTLRITDSANTFPLFVSNFNYGGSSDPPQTLAAVGFYEDKGRFAALGVNPFTSTSTAYSYREEITRNLVSWLMRCAEGERVTPTQITIAHLPGPSSYWFNHDASTHNFFQALYPQASVNAINACDNSALGACLATSQLLVIGRQMDRSDDTATKELQTNVTQVTTDVERFLQRGGAVLYVHYYRNGNPLDNALFALFGLQGLVTDTNGNYWTQAGLKNADPFAPLSTDMSAVYTAVQTLSGVNPLSAEEVCTSDAWNQCNNAGFNAKIKNGALYVKSVLAGFDIGGFDLFSSPTHKYVLEKVLVLLGDKYRTAQGARDPLTPSIAYPWAKTNYTTLAAMVFADSAVLYRRSTQPAQSELGTLYCSYRNTLLGPNGCADYKNFRTIVPRYSSLTIEEDAMFEGSVWTSTGVFALPGEPLTVRRSDDREDVRVGVAFWYQRGSTTKSFDPASGSSSTTLTQYHRPQFMRSPDIMLANNGSEVSLSSPYGGPVYLVAQNTGKPRVSEAPVRVTFNNVARHPALLDVGNDTLMAAFPAEIKRNPIPIVDIKAPSMELHMRADYFLSQLRNIDFMQNYSGPAGVSLLLQDLRFSFLESQLTLAGLKAPGKSLTQSLSPQNQAACVSLKWNCTDERIHTRRGVQHANYDERAQCGNGCSGNPFDMDWAITPLGWGEAHELGHNMQISLLQIAWLPAGLNRDNWANYQNRATENSNNIFPYYNKWRFFRVVKNYAGVVTGGWNGHQYDYYALQSAHARVNTTINGEKRTVVLDSKCKVTYSYPLGTSVTRVAQDGVYANGAYAADNDQRMAFYLQLSFIMHGQNVTSDDIPLANGFEIFTLLYQAARTLDSVSASEASWREHRASLGFSLFNRTCTTTDPCYAVYGSNKRVNSMTGNDFILVALTYITGFDWRPHYDVRGLQYSSLAEEQVKAHIASGRASKGPVSTDYYAVNDFPPADLTSAPTVRLPVDGVTAYPFNGWSVAKCNIAP